MLRLRRVRFFQVNSTEHKTKPTLEGAGFSILTTCPTDQSLWHPELSVAKES
jgi:hypothetical protein